MLNKWECHEPGCTSTAIGSGTALGLRAIGWWFETGEPTYCPAHRRDKTEKRSPDVPCDVLGMCAPCKGELEADKIQYLIAQYLEWSGEELTPFKEYAERWDSPEDRRGDQG